MVRNAKPVRWLSGRGQSIKLRPVVVGKLDSIGNIPADDEFRKARKRKRPNELIAEEEARAGFWCERTGEALRASLLGLHVAAQLHFISAERVLISPAGCE